MKVSLAPLFALFAVLSQSAWAAPGLPSEILTFDRLAEEIRAPISNKISEMKMTYRMREIPQGQGAAQIEFLNGSEMRQLALYFSRSMNEGASERTEEVQIHNARGRILFKETILTQGKGLQFSDPAKRIFFETNSADYGLKSNESSKTVILSMDGVEVFRFESIQSLAQSNYSSQITDVYFGGSKLFTISDSVSSDGSLRNFRFDVVGTSFNLNALGWKWQSRGWPTYGFKVEARKPAGFVIDNHRYFYDSSEVFGLNQFLKNFGSDVYEPFISGSATPFVKGVIDSNFPATERRASVGKSNRFLDQLIVLKGQLDQAKTNPALLPIITVTVTSFINAIQNGTLGINDMRPTE